MRPPHTPDKPFDMPTDAELATLLLSDEKQYRFPSFTSNDAITIGLSLRKRFRGSSRYAKHGRGLLISVQSIAGHNLFSCTVGDFDPTDTGLESWEHLEGMVQVVKKTGHSSFYVEKSISTLPKTAKAPEIPSDYFVKGGGRFPFENESLQ
jgi:uncharacterized protein (UPF0303 family)